MKVSSSAPRPYQGERVRKALEAGWSPVADRLAAVSWFSHRFRPRDQCPYRLIELLAGDRSVQVSISPTGRSVVVYVDGEQIPRAKP